jgi:hypothetical protein
LPLKEGVRRGDVDGMKLGGDRTHFSPWRNQNEQKHKLMK